MKSKILLFAVLALLTIACGSSRKFQASFTEDRPLFDAINALNRKASNERAQTDLSILYPRAVERHEEAARIYKTSQDENKWDRALNELNALQSIYTALQATPGSFSIVKAKNYLRPIEELKQEAAEDYYSRALNLMENGNRENSLLAYQYFQKVSYFVGGYKDVNRLSREAYERSIINVVINPIDDQNLFFTGINGNWTNYPDFRYRPEEYQNMLVRDLGGRNATNIPARFFTDADIKRDRLNADWEVNIRWRSITPLNSAPQKFTRRANKDIESGKDSAGRIIYRPIFATLTITQNNYTVQGEVEYLINNLVLRSTVDNGTIRDEITWSDSYATYTGDSRALSAEDWKLIDNQNRINPGPSKAEVLNSLMQKIYPDLRRRIQNVVR
jgi:hypothetical protein